MDWRRRREIINTDSGCLRKAYTFLSQFLILYYLLLVLLLLCTIVLLPSLVTMIIIIIIVELEVKRTLNKGSD